MSFLTKALERRTLNTQLLLGFCLMLAMVLAAALSSFLAQSQAAADVETLYSKQVLGLLNVKDAHAQHLLLGQELLQAVMATDADSRQSALQAVTVAQSTLVQTVERLRQQKPGDAGIELLSKLEQQLRLHTERLDRVVGHLKSGDSAEASRVLASKEYQEAGANVNAALLSLQDSMQSTTLKHKNEAVARGDRATQSAGLLLIVGLILSALIGKMVARSIALPNRQLRHAVQELAQGNFAVEVPHVEYRNETGELARSVQVMQQTARANASDRWVKSGLSRISTDLQTVESLDALPQVFFSNLAELIQIGHGVFYVLDDASGELHLSGSYAVHQSKQYSPSISMGEGLLGQCAQARQPIVMANPPADYARIGSGLGSSIPSAIVLLPIVRNGKLLGALELATLQDFGPREQSLIDGVLPILAMNLEILKRSQNTQNLLTETQRHAEEIQATEAWFRGIIESAPDGLLVADEHGTIIMANPRIPDLFGYSEKELIGQPVEMLVPQASRAHHPQLRDGFLNVGQPKDMGSANRTLKGLHRNGTEFAVEVGLSRLPAVGGCGVCVCASIRDVTERQRVQESMRLASAEQTAMFEATTLGIAFIRNRVIVRSNHKLDVLFGTAEGAHIGQSTRSWYISDEEYNIGGGAVYEQLARGEMHQREQELVRADGTRFWCQLSGAAIDPTDLNKGTVWMLQDTTARKLGESRLAESQATMTALINSIPDLIFYKNVEGVYLGCNQSFGKLVGRKPEEEIIGKSDHEMFPKDVADFFRNRDLDMLQSLQKQSNEEWVDYPDGRRVLLDTLKSPFWSEDGRLLGLLGISRDTTERKRMEEELKRTNFLADVALELTDSGYWYVDYSDPDHYYQSERAARILGEPLKPDGRYRLDAEWFARLEEANAETAALTAERYQGAIDGKYPSYDSIYAYKRPIDGEIVWVHVGKLVRDPETNKILFIYGAYQNVTSAKAAEQRIQESEQRVRSMLETSSEA